MAKETVAHPYDDKSEERRLLALDALWEIEAIANAIGRQSETLDSEDLWVRGFAVRLAQLASVGMSALDDGLPSALPDAANKLKPFPGIGRVVDEGRHEERAHHE